MIMIRVLILIYSFFGYLLGLASIAYIVGFLADFGVPKGISDGIETSVLRAVIIDVGLVGLFGLHHSITARASFKRWWTSFIPEQIERSTYLFMTSIMTGILVYFWHPIPITIWRVNGSIATSIMVSAYLGVWLMMVAATFHFGHFRFLGLEQAWQNFRRATPRKSEMSAMYLYALVRHPISLGWMLAPLLVPHFTAGHLVFASVTIVYIILATPFEEADLVAEIGKPYIDYQTRVPRFLPFMKRR